MTKAGTDHEHATDRANASDHGQHLPDLEYVGTLFAAMDALGIDGNAANDAAPAVAGVNDEPVLTESQPANAVECEVMSTTQDDAPMVLPGQCLLRDAVEIKSALLEGAARDVQSLDLHQVERVDAAFMQLLVALVKQRKLGGQSPLQFVGASAALHTAAQVLGLAGTLQLPEAVA